MKDRVTGTDIRYIARGYWRHAFKWGFHPRVRTPWITALVSLVAGLAVIIANAMDNPVARSVAGNSTAVAAAGSPSAITFVGGGLILAAAIFFIYGICVADSEEERFLDSVTSRWEDGDRHLPSPDTVTEFLSEPK